MGRTLIRRLDKPIFGFFHSQTGFTLIEVLVAVAIIATVGIAVLQGYQTVSTSTRMNDERMVAGSLATQYMDAIKNVPYAATYPEIAEGITVPPQYSVAVHISYSSDGTTWTSTYTDQKLQKINVAVSRESRSILSICSFRAER